MDSQQNDTRKGRGNRRLWELTPGTLRVPALPRVDLAALDPGPLSEARPQEWISKRVTLEQAMASRRTAIESARARYYEKGDDSAILDLVELAGEVGWDPNFGEVIADLYRAERLETRDRGRRFGHTRQVKDRILRVGCLVEGLRESGISLEEIFRAMERQNFGNVEKGQLRRDYREARRLPALQPQLFLREDRRRYEYLDCDDSHNESFQIERVRVVVPFAIPDGVVVRGAFRKTAGGLTLEVNLGC